MRKEFDREYGFFGENLEILEEKEERARTGTRTVHFPSEIPEYAGVDEEYRAEEKKLAEHRNQCKDEAFRLFSKWFFICGIDGVLFVDGGAIRSL